jgi:thymidylate synthase (FAD)
MEDGFNFASGFVILDSSMADDLSVVNSARVSFAKRSETLDQSAIGLINFLMRERHGTPFEHNSFRFHIKCPIFVAREWFRHRIGSFNEFSARYSEVPNEFFSPLLEDVRKQTGKPGSYTFEKMDLSDAEKAKEIIERNNTSAYDSYLELLEMGVAKELARSVLPVSMYTQFYWTVNARALMNFLSLRTAESAQVDIRKYAKDVERIFESQMPITHEAWIKNGRIAP